MSNFCSNDVLSRIRQIYNFTSNRELADYFSVKETTVSNWKTRNTIPFEVLFRTSQENDVSLDWLVTGKSKENKLDTSERMLLTAFEGLDDNQKMQAVTFVGNLASGTYSSGQGGNQTVTNSTVGNLAGGNITVNKG